MIWKFAKRRFVRGRSLLPLAVAALCLGGTLATCARQTSFATPVYNAPAPPAPVLYTATRCIRAFAVERDGSLWAATGGGVLRWKSPVRSGTRPRVWTTANDLENNDTRTITLAPDGTVLVGDSIGPIGRLSATGDVPPLQNDPTVSVGEKPARFRSEPVLAFVRSGNDQLIATASGLFWSQGAGTPVALPLPADSPGSHISALTRLPGKPGQYVVGIYGDGIYRLTPTAKAPARWHRQPLPDTCRSVTALAMLPTGQLVVGTRQEGAFLYGTDRVLVSLTQPNGLPNADIYGLAAYRSPRSTADHLFAATFDQGVLEFDARGLVQTHADVAQGRALVPFGDRLFVLGADHRVRVFDGSTWNPAWSPQALQRPEVYSLALDRFHNRLLVGGWGGWAAWDGAQWEQHWNLPQLAGEGVTAITTDMTGAVWVGTQRRGLFRCAEDAVTAFQEAQGLTDDWITALAVSPQGRLLIGTYTGGLLEKQGERLIPRFHPDRWAIRAIAFQDNHALAATPDGVFRESDNGDWQRLGPDPTGATEVQALLPTPGGCWIGTRSSLAFRIDNNTDTAATH